MLPQTPARLPAARRSFAILALAAVLGAAALVAPAAEAQRQRQQPAPPPGGVAVNRNMQAPLGAAQQAIGIQNWAEAKAQLDRADAVAVTPAEKLVVARMRYQVAETSADKPGKVTALQAIIASGGVPADQLKAIEVGLAAAMIEAGDTPGGLAQMRSTYDRYGGTPADYAALGQQFARANDNATAETLLMKAIADSSIGGAKAPESYYRVLLSIHRTTQANAKYTALLVDLIKAYPKPEYIKEHVALAQREANWAAGTDELRLDLYRALIAGGVTLNAQETYQMAREADRRVLYGEGLGVLKPAVDSGALGGASDSNAAGTNQLLTQLTTKAAREQSSLATEERDVGRTGTPAELAALGEVFLTYGQYDKAVQFIQRALTAGLPPGPRTDGVRLHLGIAQYKAGQKDAARATWAQITGDNGAAALARSWTLISEVRP
jgi:tetratricopeptide (TPR) repeat protein